jgi:hypothetical protein
MLSRIDSGTSYTGGMPVIKKALPGQKSFEYVEYF